MVQKTEPLLYFQITSTNTDQYPQFLVYVGGYGVVEGLVGGMREGKDAKTCFSAGHVVYVYYFKNIRPGELQSDCVMIFSWCMCILKYHYTRGGLNTFVVTIYSSFK